LNLLPVLACLLFCVGVRSWLYLATDFCVSLVDSINRFFADFRIEVHPNRFKKSDAPIHAFPFLERYSYARLVNLWLTHGFTFTRNVIAVDPVIAQARSPHSSINPFLRSHDARFRCDCSTPPNRFLQARSISFAVAGTTIWHSTSKNSWYSLPSFGSVSAALFCDVIGSDLRLSFAGVSKASVF